MSSEFGRMGHLSTFRARHPAWVFVFVTFLYLVFAWYLYNPYFKYFSNVHYLAIVNLPLASLGCFILSSRWVKSFAASFFAGALYGFGPFLFSLTTYHPAAGFLGAAVPWLFLPAAFFGNQKWRFLRVPLSLLPVVVIAAGFFAAARIGFYPLPIEKMSADVIGVMFSVVPQNPGQISIGFYHAPVAPLVMGLMLLVLMRRFKVMIIILAGLVLSFCDPFLAVSPVMWLALPAVCGAILVAVGVEAIVRAGQADMKWLFAGAAVCAAGFVAAIAPASFGSDDFFYAAAMYAMMAVVMAIILFLIKAEIRTAWPRWLLICMAMGLDVFVSASYIVDKMFLWAG